ncbi:MAG TPA: hypothetical protein VHY22_07500 [Chthoniobacteraceae bacterium]|jgi:hypothetical protein|nr:hypothetical protein [Chthoniobacteraceae bacterium]
MPLRLALIVLCVALAAPARAGEPSSPPPTAIWSGLILATNDPHPSEPPPELRKWVDKLHTIFGYNDFELVGENSERVDDPNHRRLVPSKDFSLSVSPHPATPNGRLPLTLTLFENHHRLAEIEARLHPNHPLFIRGPEYAGGELVIVIRALAPSEAPVRIYHPAVVVPPPYYYGAPVVTAYPPFRPRIRGYPSPAYYMLMRHERVYPYERLPVQRPGDYLDPRFMRP